jgi:hypothetical protein
MAAMDKKVNHRADNPALFWSGTSVCHAASILTLQGPVRLPPGWLMEPGEEIIE